MQDFSYPIVLKHASRFIILNTIALCIQGNKLRKYSFCQNKLGFFVIDFERYIIVCVSQNNDLLKDK